MRASSAKDTGLCHAPEPSSVFYPYMKAAKMNFNTKLFLKDNV
jgi:hypothetical protein